MRIADYPPQEPLSENGQRYQTTTLGLGRGIEGRDVSLGAHPCQALSLFEANNPNGTVLAFLYGGGWTNGYKEMMAFMAPALTVAGVTFASIGYRLAPEFVFPTGWLDVARGVSWLRQHVAKYGGDPRRIFIGGHSAGGHYAALLAVRRDWQRATGLPVSVIRGCLPVSGIYDFLPGNGMAQRPRFLGAAVLNQESPASPLSNILSRPPPFLLAHGENDFPHLVTQAKRMEIALRAAGADVERIVLPGRDHFEACYDVGDPAGPWIPVALDWLRHH